MPMTVIVQSDAEYQVFTSFPHPPLSSSFSLDGARSDLIWNSTPSPTTDAAVAVASETLASYSACSAVFAWIITLQLNSYQVWSWSTRRHIQTMYMWIPGGIGFSEGSRAVWIGIDAFQGIAQMKTLPTYSALHEVVGSIASQSAAFKWEGCVLRIITMHWAVVFA